jgi:FixJ family two-component response regulator
MMRPEVFLYFNGKQEGPFTLVEAQQKWRDYDENPDILYWKPGMDEWSEAKNIFFHEPDKQLTKASNVLVVDDDIIMCEYVAHLLRSQGYTYRVATNVDPACRLVEETGIEKFDCVVTDYQMPGGSGLDFVRWIKQRDEALSTLMLTARGDKDLVKRGLRAGIHDFLEKPVQEDELYGAIRSAVTQTARRREEKTAFLEMISTRLSGQGNLAEEVIASLARRESSVNSLFGKLENIVEYSNRLEQGDVLDGRTRPMKDQNMSGSLKQLSVLDLLHLLIHSGKTGKLKIDGSMALLSDEAHCGYIFLEGGKIVHATYGDETGYEAVRYLLACPSGSFEFYYEERSTVRTIRGDSMTLLLSISSQLDEQKLAF